MIVEFYVLSLSLFLQTRPQEYKYLLYVYFNVLKCPKNNSMTQCIEVSIILEVVNQKANFFLIFL